MRPTGKIGLFGMLLLAGLAGGIYSLVMFAPLYADNMDVTEVLNGVHTLAGKTDDDRLRQEIRERLRYVGTHEADDGFGNVTMATGLGLKDDDIVIERDGARGTVKIQVNYRRKVLLKPSKRVVWMKFNPKKEGPVAP